MRANKDAQSQVFLSTLPARGATLYTAKEVKAEKISIHAPREGSDAGKSPLVVLMLTISIHAPREGSDLFS